MMNRIAPQIRLLLCALSAASILSHGSEESDTNAAAVPPLFGPPEVEARDFKHPQAGLFNGAAEVNEFQVRLEAARTQRRIKDLKRAETTLVQLLESFAPDEIKRPALLELAQVTQEQKQFQKAQTLYSEYVRRYSQDPSTPEVLLRQGYLYREMGIPSLALSKFYRVISTCLNLKLDEMDYYKALVLRSQTEIAETYFLQGKFGESSEFYKRLLKLEPTADQQAEITYKLTRCYAGLDKHSEVVASARLYLDQYPDGPDAAETRFMLADALKKLDQNSESVKEIFTLLRTQNANSGAAPEQWLYWQQRAGNTIANQLYREGDYLNALQVYEALAELNRSADWQLPVWYQIALVFENLKQTRKATEMYEKIVKRAEETTESAPSLKTIMEMAAWRKQYLEWEEKARQANAQLEPPLANNLSL